MPEWITPLLRGLVDIPSFGNCSTRKTSCQRCDRAAAMAQPTTPPPMIRTSTLSMTLQNTSERTGWQLILLVANFIEEILAGFQARFGTVMNGDMRDAVSIAGGLPKRRSAVLTIFVEGIVGKLEGAEFLFVSVVITHNPAEHFKASVRRFRASSHQLHRRVAAGNFDIFLAFTG